MFDIQEVRFDAQGLVPAVAQDAHTGQVLMLAYMNEASLRATLASGYATYWSRSRASLWRKGETSGHTQQVRSLAYDCDGDALLLTVEQTGPACHTGEQTCFHHTLALNGVQADDGDAQTAAEAMQAALAEVEEPPTSQVLEAVYAVIQDRMTNPKEGSYTNYLLAKGVEKIAKKVGEEATETVIAAIKDDAAEICYEAADLCYHLLVLLAERGIPLSALWQELAQRR